MVWLEPVSSRKVMRFSSILPSLRIMDSTVRKGTRTLRGFARLGMGTRRSRKHSSARKTRAEARTGRRQHTPLTHAAAAKIAGRLAAELALKERCNINLMYPALFWQRTKPPRHPRSECSSQSLDSNDHQPPFIDRRQTFS